MRTILLLALAVSAAGFAKGGPKGMRMGGVGYLMPDGNDFTNSSQMPMTMGFGVQALYATIPATSLALAVPSAVWGNGTVGLGAYGARTGTSMSDSANYSDSIGGAMGLGFAGGRMSLGVGYNRGIGSGQTNDGTLRADFALNAVKGSGFIFGVGASTTVNAVVTRRTANVGVGYQLSVNNSFEAYYSMNDLDNKDNTTMGGYATLGGKMLYFGGGALYQNPAKITQAVLRLGVRLGSRVDISGFTTQTFSSGYDPLYGGTFRLMF